MAVTPQNVREKVLRGITEAILPDDNITFWIEIATLIAEGNISETISTADKERVITVLSSYYSLLSYATYVQMSSGRPPPTHIGMQIDQLNRASSVLLSIISRADGPLAPPTTLVVAGESVLDAGKV